MPGFSVHAAEKWVVALFTYFCAKPSRTTGKLGWRKK